MLLRVRALAFLEDDDGEEVEFPEAWSFAARRLDDQELANYLDATLVDAGVSGGELWFRREEGCWYVDLDYWCGANLAPGQLELLLEAARGQLSDGAGECMELEEADELDVILCAGEGEAQLVVLDDGRSVPPPNKVALFAKNGKSTQLKAELERASHEDIGRLHGGLSPLAWACSNGHADAALILLQAGALPRDSNAALNEADHFDPLRTCVLSSACADAAALKIAQALVEHGIADDFDSLAEQASARAKTQLASYLRTQN